MRIVLVLLLLVGPLVVLACVPSGGSKPVASTAETAESGLILQYGEGERRVRRPRPDNAGRVAAPALIVKVNEQLGGSSNFFVASEEIPPGETIAPHMHPEYDEILFVHRGQGVATLGSQQAVVSEGATLYIPPDTRVSLRNTGAEPLSILFIFPQPEVVSAYYRELSVLEGQPVIPFSTEEFAAFRARHRSHVMFESP